jgi:hypothetical protein
VNVPSEVSGEKRVGVPGRLVAHLLDVESLHSGEAVGKGNQVHNKFARVLFLVAVDVVKGKERICCVLPHAAAIQVNHADAGVGCGIVLETLADGVA